MVLMSIIILYYILVSFQTVKSNICNRRLFLSHGKLLEVLKILKHSKNLLFSLLDLNTNDLFKCKNFKASIQAL